MIKPNIKLNNNAGVSYYSLVVAIAKRAREIANEAELKGEILIEKPVDLAVDEFIEGDFKIVEPHACSGKPCCCGDNGNHIEESIAYMPANQGEQDQSSSAL